MSPNRDTLLQCIRERHSVRAYTDQPLDAEVVQRLQDELDLCNQEGGLHLQLVTNEPNAFNSRMAHYGHFSNVSNYIALVGTKDSSLDERLGYYGERLVLLAQSLGLRSCWVGMSYSKRKGRFHIGEGERLRGVIALGHGATDGVQHKIKQRSDICKVAQPLPDWFEAGLDAALLAPTAMNQQKFSFGLVDGKVTAKAGFGFYTQMDLGIVKLHFEIAAGKENFTWA